MAYVPNCKCDVFVSFAHLDDVATGKTPRWVSSFTGDLKKALRMRLGIREEGGLRVCFTGHASPGARMPPESTLTDASSAAIFVAVTSPAYVAENSWSMRELAAFKQAAGGEGRVFAIEHSPLDRDAKYPPLLREPKRIAFWQRHRGRDTPVTIPTGSEIYRQTLFDLAEQIRGQLKTMREEQKAATASIVDLAKAVFVTTATPVKLPAEGRTVFLAQAPGDLEEERAQVRRYLQQYGATVLPENVYPQGEADFAQALEADLMRAEVFVQLLGSTHAERAADMPSGYDRLQYERAVARGLPVLQWLRPDIDPAAISDPERAQLLAVESVMRMGLEGFKAEVVKRVGKPPPRSSSGDQQFIFIDADGSDLQLAEDLRRELKRADLIASVPVLRGSSEEVRLDLEENIARCDVLVVVYGETTPDWVRGQLRLYSKLKHRRKQPLKALALYVGPPEAKPNIGMDLPEIKTIDCREGAAAESLRQFLAGQHQ